MRQADTQPQPKHSSFYFFVNTKSGNRQGQQIMDLSLLDLHPHLDPHIRLRFVDLFDSNSRDTSVDDLKSVLSDELSPVRIIICGGDGTINWVINELIKHEVNLGKCLFGVIPIGTGNDFCRSIGWPVQPFHFSIDNFALQVQSWIGASICKYDIWDVSIQTFKGGKILDVKDRKSVERKDGALTKAFTNYVGIGVDARVTYTVEKIRTPYACINKMLYACVGFLNLLRPIKPIKKIISSFTESTGGFLSSQDTISILGEEELKSTKAMEVNRRQNLMGSVKKKFKGLVCLNATSYMAGLRNVWQTNHVATDTPDKEFYPQAIGDEKVEFIAFRNELSLGLERVVRSGAKVTQGSGPFEMSFRANEREESIYLQIDGESMNIVKLKSVRIAKSSRIAAQQINVMVGPNI